MTESAISSGATTALQPKQFRHDINGLRAIAVAAVVLYHFGIPGFTGGFVGVDVFFVISGFLMTGIIVSGLDRGNFSLWGFYLARARRIVPALLVLCASLLLLGWFWLPDIEYKLLTTHIVTALAFVSNVKFWREAGYFDAASHEKWLLHTWSLSVEWQFYILLPLGCLLVWRLLGKRALQWTLLVLGAGSLLLSLYASQRWPVPAFYLLPTRIWEMLAGGLVWWLTRQHHVNARLSTRLEGAGLLLIGLAIVLFDTSLTWPGPAALVPVVGAMLVLGAQRQQSPWTANLLSRRLGASSYSLYLWHWPLVVILNYASEQHNPAWIGAGLLLTLLLGEASLRWVENPTRKVLTALPTRQQISAVILVVGCLGVLSVGLWGALKTKQSWMTGRIDSSIELAENEALNTKPRREECFTTSGNTSKSCVYGGENIKAVVIGDSHADAITTSVQASLPNKIDGIVDWSYVSCPTIAGLHIVSDNPSENCYEFNIWASKKIKSYNNTVPLIIINRTSAYAFGQHNIKEKMNMPLSYFHKENKEITQEFLDEYKKTIIETACFYAKERPVYITRPIPEMMADVPKTMVRAMMFGRPIPEVSISLDEYHQRHAMVWAAQDEAARQCGVKILNPLPYLCHDGRCWGSKAGRPLYYDDDHLSEYGNKLLVPMFKQVWTES